MSIPWLWSHSFRTTEPPDLKGESAVESHLLKQYNDSYGGIRNTLRGGQPNVQRETNFTDASDRV